MLKKTLLILALVSVVSGCAGTSVILSECAVHKKIEPTTQDVDVISDQLVGQVLRHNDLIKKRCAQ